MRCCRKYRHKHWALALLAGVFLAGEIHLFCAEILHHHAEVATVCQMGHHGGRYLHAVQDPGPVCPLCQIVRSSSVRPAVQSIAQNPERESNYQSLARQVRCSLRLTASLPARAPPLS